MRDEIVWAIRHVLTSPARLRFLCGDGFSIPIPLFRFLRRIVPHASRELEGIASLASSIPDQRLRTEALGSINAKAYHVAGGCILATFLPSEAARRYVEIVTPLESIYDYLDNLCDRHPDVPVEAYPVLHQAIADALDPRATLRDYYALGPTGDDNGYLARLVTRTQRSFGRLDRRDALFSAFSEAATLYAEMQTYKHYPPLQRESACIEWFERRRDARFVGLQWYEFACAAGSQLQVYAPLFAYFANHYDAVTTAYDAYFPSVAALHVLLDSYIDQAEDREHGELNFATLYAGPEQMRRRVADFATQATLGFERLPNPAHHRFVLRVMALFYLTHPKIYAQGLQREAESLLRAVSSRAEAERPSS
jgi:tetraprenyl-beta-curcumene synthase